MLVYYWPNLLAGIFIAIGMGLIGLHVIARNQAFEAFVLGQEIQSSIILSAYVLVGFDFHQDHGLHLESSFSLLLAFGIHILFLRFAQRFRHLRMEIAVVFIFLLMALNNFLMSHSPLIEGHMVESLLGDIATTSMIESIAIVFIGLGLIFFYSLNNKRFLDETVEIALFDRAPKGPWLTLTLVFFMGVSVHFLGLLFTLGMLLMGPLTLNLLGSSNYRLSQMILMTINALSVILGFFAMNVMDRTPTSVSIVMSSLFLCLLYSLLYRWTQARHL